MNNIWVVVPAYNEEKYVKRVIRKVLKHTSNVIVVDDGSLDNTTAESQSIAPYTLTHRVNLGKGAALKTGCDFAFNTLKAEAIVIMDADDQHDPAELPLFIAELKKGESVVFGTRRVDKEMPWLRSLSNKMASILVKLFFGAYIPDIPSGYKAFTRQAYKQLRWSAVDYAVELELAARTARFRLPFSTVCIKTIYHDMNKGMTMLDVLSMTHQLLNWKLTL
jgi:glycosyltransferase involved in cell wall biosynthesis